MPHIVITPKEQGIQEKIVSDAAERGKAPGKRTTADRSAAARGPLAQPLVPGVQNRTDAGKGMGTLHSFPAGTAACRPTGRVVCGLEDGRRERGAVRSGVVAQLAEQFTVGPEKAQKALGI